jgi:putative addiction module component (TIGR02574 family)
MARLAPASGQRENDGVSHLNIGIKSLTPEERLALLEEIWDSLEPEAAPVTYAQRRELDRRLDAFERDRGIGIPWDEVLRQIRERPR